MSAFSINRYKSLRERRSWPPSRTCSVRDLETLWATLETKLRFSSLKILSCCSWRETRRSVSALPIVSATLARDNSSSSVPRVTSICGTRSAVCSLSTARQSKQPLLSVDAARSVMTFFRARSSSKEIERYMGAGYSMVFLSLIKMVIEKSERN